MSLRKVVPLVVIYACVSVPAPAQKDSLLPPSTLPTKHTESFDPDKTVLALSELRIYGPAIVVKYGTGFCVDPACKFVATNHHVAVESNARKIKGQRIVNRYFATGPDADGASVNQAKALLVAAKKYNTGRDLAIYELRYRIEKHNGIPSPSWSWRRATAWTSTPSRRRPLTRSGTSRHFTQPSWPRPISFREKPVRISTTTARNICSPCWGSGTNGSVRRAKLVQGPSASAEREKLGMISSRGPRVLLSCK